MKSDSSVIRIDIVHIRCFRHESTSPVITNEVAFEENKVQGDHEKCVGFYQY